MPLDVSGYIVPQQQYGGLYTAAQTLEQRRQREIQLGLQQQRLKETDLARKQAAASFLNNYVDKEHQLTGTVGDTYINPMLDHVMNQATALAAKGVDTPTIMQTINPLIQRISLYSARAKAVDKQTDQAIQLHRDNKDDSYDYAKLKEVAMQKAFHDIDQNGNMVLNPDKADPNINWVEKTIQEDPEKVTTSAGFDQYAKEQPRFKTGDNQAYYSPSGELNSQKVHLIAPTYLVPERQSVTDKMGHTMNKITGFVPKYDTATDENEPLLHEFEDKQGQKTTAPIRLLDEGIFDSLKPGLHNYLIGQLKPILQAHEQQTGEHIPIDSPKAKMISRALAYDELKIDTRSKNADIEYAGIEGKPSQAQVNLNIRSTDAYNEAIKKNAEARAEGTAEGKKAASGNLNTIDALLESWNGNPDYNSGPTKVIGGRKLIDITSKLPKAKLQFAPGVKGAYEAVYKDPMTNEMLLKKKGSDEMETVTPDQAKMFAGKIATANGVALSYVTPSFNKAGFSNSQFTRSKMGDMAAQLDAENRARSAKIEPSLKDFEKNGGVDKLKDFEGKEITLEGKPYTISSLNSHAFYRTNNYYATLKDANGKTIDHDFKTRQELTNWIRNNLQ